MLGTVTNRENKLSVYVTNLSNSLVKGVNERFSDTKDGSILSALSDLFNPVSVPVEMKGTWTKLLVLSLSLELALTVVINPSMTQNLMPLWL